MTYFYSELAGKNVHAALQVLNFDIKDGIAALAKNFGDPRNPQGYDPDLLREDPHGVSISMEDDIKYIESTTEEVDVSMSALGEPQIETNSEFYTPVAKVVDSNFTPFNASYPEYGEYIQIISGGHFEGNKIGRWHSENLESLATSMTRRVVVDDTTAPEVPHLNGNQSVEYSVDINDDVDNMYQDSVNKSNITDASKARYDLNILVSTASTQIMDGSVNQVKYDIVKTIEVSDVRENKTTKTFTYNVDDTEAPLAELSTYAVQINKGEDVLSSIEVISTSDNSNLPLNEEKQLNPAYPNGIFEETNAYRKYSVLVEDIDVAGNTTIKEAFVTENLDDLPPTFTIPANTTVELTESIKFNNGVLSLVPKAFQAM